MASGIGITTTVDGIWTAKMLSSDLQLPIRKNIENRVHIITEHLARDQPDGYSSRVSSAAPYPWGPDGVPARLQPRFSAAQLVDHES